MANSRKNTPRFTDNEVNTLLEVCMQEIKIIENKRTDAVSSKDKEAAWERITTAFNQRSIIHLRTAKHLRGKFDNIKKEVKRKLSEEKVLVKSGTGGGKGKKIVLTAAEERVASILGARATGLPSDFDDDRSTNINEQEFYDSNARYMDEVEEYETVYDQSLPPSSDLLIDVQEVTKDIRTKTYDPVWSTYNPSQLRKMKSPALVTSVSVRPSATEVSVHPSTTDDCAAKSSVLPDDCAKKRSLNPPPTDNLEKSEDEIGTKRKRFVKDKVTAWAAGRAELVDLQREAFEKKTSLDMSFREEEHRRKLNVELQILQLKQERESYLLQVAKEKSKIEIEILNLEKSYWVQKNVSLNT